MLDLMPALAAWQPAATGQRCAVATVVGAGGSVPRPVGTSMLVSGSGDVLGSLSGGCVEGAVVAAALEVMADGGTRREFFGSSAEDAVAVGLTCRSELEVHIELLAETVGGLRPEGAALVPAARLLGYHVALGDARPAFTGQERFAAADQVVTDWPHRYLAAEAAAGRLDARTVVCVLTHDPKFDIPLLQTALRLDLAYVGAMGSRRSHGQRMASLLAAGVEPEEAERLHSPIGLDLGAVTPAEVAVSITAELVAGRSRSARGLSLKIE